MLLFLDSGRPHLLARRCAEVVELQYERSDKLSRGKFRVRGDVVEVFPLPGPGRTGSAVGAEIDSFPRLSFARRGYSAAYFPAFPFIPRPLCHAEEHA